MGRTARSRLTACFTLLLTLLAMPAAARPAADVSPTLRLNVDSPANDVAALGDLVVAGWAADPGAARGTGVRAVHVYLDRPPWEGGMLLGAADYGQPRADVGRLLGGERFVPVGFRFRWQVAAPPGPHPLYVLAQDDEGEWGIAERTIVVDPRAPRYQPLAPPGDNDNPVNRINALATLRQMRDAMAGLTSMREHRLGRVYTAEGREVNTNLYNLEYQAPDRRSQRSTVTTEVDSAEQRIVTIGETSWFWRPDGHWEATTNRDPFEFPADLAAYRNVFGAQELYDDEIDGRAYRVVEFEHSGSDWIGAPGWTYRTRLWIDAETNLPLKLEKAANQTQLMEGMVAVTVTYREQTEFFDFNVPISIEPPG